MHIATISSNGGVVYSSYQQIFLRLLKGKSKDHLFEVALNLLHERFSFKKRVDCDRQSHNSIWWLAYVGSLSERVSKIG